MAKATKKQVLGRGLTSILKDSKNKASTISKIKTNYSTEIEISKIILNPFQPRSAFNKEKLEELIISIKNIGLIQPITVKKLSKNEFQLISGERRLRAFKQLKINKIPCYIRIVLPKYHPKNLIYQIKVTHHLFLKMKMI